MSAAEELLPQVGAGRVCDALGVSRATLYRRRRRETTEPPPSRPPPARALESGERQQVLEVLRSERFMDQPPAEVYATLLDEEVYLCSVRTMYRILDGAEEVRERRNQLRHPAYAKPEPALGPRRWP